LQPGEVYLAREPTLIRTILGSCVGVAFWSTRFRAGALCHALLPRCPRETVDPVQGHRYVDFSILELAREFDQIGVSRREVQVKLFGGADVLPVGDSNPLRPTVGRMNCEVAIEVLRDEGFEVAASSLGGTTGRSILFHTGTGEVQLRWLARTVPEDVIEG